MHNNPMLDKKDAQWWRLEAQNHPDKAVDLIRLLADRMTFLDRQNEELRAALIALRRNQGGASNAEMSALQQRVQELETALRQNTGERQLIVYGPGRIEANLPLLIAQQNGLGHDLPANIAMLLCGVTAKLFAVCADSRIYSLAARDLPVPERAPITFEQPRDVVAFVDQSAFDQHRYLLLISQKGYAYSVLAGTLNRVAARNEKVIRNLLPDDSIVAAIPSNNVDIFAVSRKGRWTRFAEKAIAGTSSLIMELPKGDALASVIALGADTDLVFLTSDGKLFMRASAELPSRKTPGRSAGALFRDQARDQQVLGVRPLQMLGVLTAGGKLITLQPGQIGARAQSESGLIVPGLAAEDTVVALFP